MALQRNKIINQNSDWNPNRRYKVNAVVKRSGGVYQNTTGFNSDPVDENDWMNISVGVGGITITPYNVKVKYVGSIITVPAGFTGIITNLNDTYADVTFTVSGTTLTVTGGANNEEILLINGKY